MKNNDLQSRLDPDIIRKLDEKHIKYERYMPSTRHRNYISWQDGFMTKDRKVPALYAVLIARGWLFVLILSRWGGWLEITLPNISLKIAETNSADQTPSYVYLSISVGWIQPCISAFCFVRAVYIEGWISLHPENPRRRNNFPFLVELLFCLLNLLLFWRSCCCRWLPSTQPFPTDR